MESTIGNERMEHYRKLYNLKRLEVKIPRLTNIPYQKLRSNRNGAEKFRRSENPFSQEENSIVFPQPLGMENSVVDVSQCYPTDDELTSPPVLQIEESNDHYSEGFSSHNDVCLSRIQTEEPENDVFVVTIDGEVVHLYEKIKEETEKSAETYRAQDIVGEETEPKISPGRDCNSISTFIEKEEESIMDRTYFHVFSMEVEEENEVFLRGVFVEDS